MTVCFEQGRFHVGYVFEKDYGRQRLPVNPPRGASLLDLEQYKKEYPGVAILNHPTWRDKGRQNTPEQTAELISSGVFGGIETLNGSILYNGFDPSFTRSALGMYMAATRSGSRIASIGASDAHREFLVGSVVTEFCGSTEHAIFEAVEGCNTKAFANSSDVQGKVRVFLEDMPQLAEYIGCRDN